MKKSFLILENGTVFEGRCEGSEKEVISEIVFNTSMTGYLEVLTDPSYAGQSVCMTYPLIGNYGICRDDAESERPHVDAFIVHELSRLDSNFRSAGTLKDYLAEYDIPCISGVDTRKLTKLLRESGTMNGMITTDEGYSLEEIIPRLKEYKTGKVVDKVTTSGIYEVGSGSRKIAILDVGMKKDIALKLAKRDCTVIVYPAATPAEVIISEKPDGIMISNGPGDPKECTGVIKEIKKLYDTDIPIFAICLGHQLMALSVGGDTHRLKYGHRGANHPVKDLETGRVYITSQNHGYVVDESSIPSSIAVPAFVNVNDGTNEGLKYTDKNIFTVQFHPEACAGPLDSEYLFDKFMYMIEQRSSHEL